MSCIAGERPTIGMVSAVARASGSSRRRFGSASARPTMATSSRRSKGLGRYSYAPRSEALIAVMNVFCALITMIGRSGRIRLMRGSRSKALSSGMTTSVMTRSPSPAATQRHSPATVPVARTSYPARVSAWLSTVRIPASSSATKICPDGIHYAPSPNRAKLFTWGRPRAATEAASGLETSSCGDAIRIR